MKDFMDKDYMEESKLKLPDLEDISELLELTRIVRELRNVDITPLQVTSNQVPRYYKG